MRAWQMPSLGDPWTLLEPVELPDLKAPTGMLRLKVAASDLNFADILQCQGNYQVKLDPPFTPGMTAAGTVIEAGPGSNVAVGSAVVGPTVDIHGGFAEEALVLADQAQVLPAGQSFYQAAAMYMTYSTAWFALHQRGQLAPGETVLVLAGAGGVGSAAIQLAKSHGCWVVAAAGGKDKTAICKNLGADAVIDYRSQSLYQAVKELTDGRGVDVIYDPVGGEHFEVARRLLAWEGRLLIIGFASGNVPSAPMNHALVKNYSLIGVHMGGYRQADPRPFGKCFNQLFELLAAGRIDPLVAQVIGFADLPNALQRLADRQTHGRIIFDPSRGLT